MGIVRVFAISALVLAVVAGFYLNNHIPANTANPWKFATVMGLFKLMNHICIVGEYFDVNPLITTQTIVEVFQTYGHPSLPDTVMVSNEMFEDIPVRIYQPSNAGKNRPGLIFLHGGGFRMGTPYGYEIFCGRLVQELGIVVISVDYRLAPQHTVPAAFDDSEAAALYFFTHAKSFGVDPKNIGVAGDSAGGNLAAALSLWLRDGGNAPQFAFQLLLYPWLQSFDLNMPSYHKNDHSAYSIVSKQGIAKITLVYLNQSLEYIPELMTNSHTTPELRDKYGQFVDWELLPTEYIPKGYTRPRNSGNAKLSSILEEELTSPYTFPGMAEDLTNLPPAFVLTVDNDCLRDEGIIFAMRMEEAGSPVVHYDDKEGWHGMFCFMHEPLSFTAAHKATDAIVQFIRHQTNT